MRHQFGRTIRQFQELKREVGEQNRTIGDWHTDFAGFTALKGKLSTVETTQMNNTKGMKDFKNQLNQVKTQLGSIVNGQGSICTAV